MRGAWGQVGGFPGDRMGKGREGEGIAPTRLAVGQHGKLMQNNMQMSSPFSAGAGMSPKSSPVKMNVVGGGGTPAEGHSRSQRSG